MVLGHPALSQAAPLDFRIAPEAISVGFTVEQVGFPTIKGHFPSARGRFTYDPSTQTLLSATLSVRVRGLHTGSGMRDGILESARFFDAAAHPLMAVHVTDAHALDDAHGRVQATVIVRGATRPLGLVLTLEDQTGTADAPCSLTVTGSGSLSRAAFAMDHPVYDMFVDDEVRLSLRFTATRDGTGCPAP